MILTLRKIHTDFILTTGDDFHSVNLKDGDTAYHRKLNEIGTVSDFNSATGSWLFNSVNYKNYNADSYKLFKVIASVSDMPKLFRIDKANIYKIVSGDRLFNITDLKNFHLFIIKHANPDLTLEENTIDYFFSKQKFQYWNCTINTVRSNITDATPPNDFFNNLTIQPVLINDKTLNIISIDLSERSVMDKVHSNSLSALTEYLKNTPKEEIQAFFNQFPKPPTGWVNIEYMLPECPAIDWLSKGFKNFKVKDIDGKEFPVPVGGDPLIWKYEIAQPNNITHWWNGKNDDDAL